MYFTLCVMYAMLAGPQRHTVVVVCKCVSILYSAEDLGNRCKVSSKFSMHVQLALTCFKLYWLDF